MVKFQFSKQKTKSAEKISQQVFYIMIGLAVLVSVCSFGRLRFAFRREPRL